MRLLVPVVSLLHGSAPSPRASPIRCVRDDMSPTLAPNVDRSAYIFGTVEPRDINSCIEVLMQGFYKDILTLAANEFSEEEMEVLRPTLTRFNGALKWLTRVLLTYEAGKRLGSTLPVGGFDRPATRGDGLMIAMQHRESGSIVGVVEISEQPCDGKVPGDVRLPWAPKQSEVKHYFVLPQRTRRPELSTAQGPHFPASLATLRPPYARPNGQVPTMRRRPIFAILGRTCSSCSPAPRIRICILFCSSCHLAQPCSAHPLLASGGRCRTFATLQCSTTGADAAWEAPCSRLARAWSQRTGPIAKSTFTHPRRRSVSSRCTAVEATHSCRSMISQIGCLRSRGERLQPTIARRSEGGDVSW